MSFDLERELKRALHREDASPDFTDRVMTRIVAPGSARRKRSREETRWWRRLMEFFQPARVKWAAAGVAAFLLAFAAIGVHRYRAHQAEMAEGERAKEQVMLAMKIASAKLNIAQKKIAGSR
jgi:Predicted integral membrane protein (DUF2275)